MTNLILSADGPIAKIGGLTMDSITKMRLMSYVNSVRIIKLKVLHGIVRLTVRDGAGPSLLAQLRESLTNNGNGGDKGKGVKSRMLISADAFDLITSLELEWATKERSLEDGFIHAYHILLGMHDDIHEWRLFDKDIESVVTEIDNLLNPGRRFNLIEPCPACGSKMAYATDSSGEEVRRYALVLDTTRGCLCLSCGAAWPVTELEDLALVLGCAPLPIC